MIQNIIFDIGQVLAKFRWKEYMNDLGFSKELKERIGKVTVQSSFWKEVDRGVMSLEEIIEGCIKLEPELEKEIRLFYRDMSTIVIEYKYAEELLFKLKKQGYRIYLLSNYGERNFSYIAKKFRFLKYIDGQIISYQIQHIKPEPEIYRALLEKYQLDPENSIFLDDLEENLEMAKTFGIKTIHFTSLYSSLEKLRNFGVTLPKLFCEQTECYDGLMFDLDGTLWDSTTAAAKIWGDVVKRRGLSYEVTPQRLKQLYGLPLEEIAVELFPEISKEEAIDIMEECVVVQCPVLSEKGGTLLGKIKETLQDLSKRYPIFIISNCRSGYIEAFLKANQLENIFTDTACPGDTGKLKADNIRLVMERNHILNPIYIGDTNGDSMAAKDANVPFIFARYGFGMTDQYDAAIDSIEELIPVLGLLEETK